MRNLTVRLERVLANPLVRLLVGVLLVASGLSEVLETVHEDVQNHSLRGAHGVVLLGLYHTYEAAVGVLKVVFGETSGSE